MLRLSSMLLPWCEQRSEHPLPWHTRGGILAWVMPAPSSATQKGQGGTRGGQELPVPAAWGERQRPLVSRGSPLFQ